jgi:hypothetical protein
VSFQTGAIRQRAAQEPCRANRATRGREEGARGRHQGSLWGGQGAWLRHENPAQGHQPSQARPAGACGRGGDARPLSQRSGHDSGGGGGGVVEGGIPLVSFLNRHPRRKSGSSFGRLQKEAGFPAFAGMTMVESTWQAADGRIKSGHDVFFGVMRGLDPAHLLATGRWPGLRPAMTLVGECPTRGLWISPKRRAGLPGPHRAASAVECRPCRCDSPRAGWTCRSTRCRPSMPWHPAGAK